MRHFTFFNVVITLFLANLIGPLLGTVLQKYVTTCWDVRDREIVGIEQSWEQPAPLLLLNWVAVPQKTFLCVPGAFTKGKMKDKTARDLVFDVLLRIEKNKILC